MIFSRLAAVAATLLPLAVATPTGPSCKRTSSCPSDATSYCPSVCNPDTPTRLELFKAFNNQLFSGDAAGAFGKYVSPELVEHSAGATSFAEDVGFLSALIPTVDIAPVGNLLNCVGDVCFIHYKASPKASGSPFINNVTAISDFYRYDGSCIVEHWDTVQTADASTVNPNFPGN